MKILLFHVTPTYHLGLHQHVHKASSTFGLLQMLLVREVPIRSSWLHFMRHIMLQFILHLVAATIHKHQVTNQQPVADATAKESESEEETASNMLH